MSATKLLSDARNLIFPALRGAVDRLDPYTAAIVRYHLGLTDAAGTPVSADSGKMLRGCLALVSARAADAPGEAALPAAVAVELVHQYSLLHDDIIDHDAERRHRPAAWTVFGTEQTILAGDALATLAIETVLDAPGVQVPTPTVSAAALLLSKASRRMVAGQSADLAFETAATVSIDEALAMVADKTGALLGCAASIGAVAVGAPQALSANLAAFGRDLGLAFQLVDDLMGLWGDPSRTGKPVGSDLVSRKRSLPVVAALSAGGDVAARIAERYADPRPIDDHDVATLLAAIEAAGGRDWAQAEADRYTKRSLDAISDMALPDDVRADLNALTVMLCHRDH